jgi:hypothetical protein
MANHRVQQIKIPEEVVDFDQDAFDNLVKRVGVPLIHYKAIRSPVGMASRDDIRKPNGDITGTNSGGFIYRRAGVITGLFTNVNNSNRNMDLGEADGSTVEVTLPRFYDDAPETSVRAVRYDRMYLHDPRITVSDWQIFTTHETGYDRLTYPVVDVELLVDSYGDEYDSKNDFVIWNGQLKWVGKRPPANTVCSIRYQYRPYWYVSRLIHEVRVTNRENVLGERETIRMPIRVTLQREYVFESDTNNPEAPQDSRQVKQPQVGSFGPR